MKRLMMFVIGLSPLKKEALRMILCALFAMVLDVLLVIGVEENGDIKEWAVWSINFLTSTTMLRVMVLLIPIFLYTILKAVILRANDEYRGFLGFLASQCTGVFYCMAFISFALAHKASSMEGQLPSEFVFLGIQMLFCGFSFFYIFQSAIQKTLSPKVL